MKLVVGLGNPGSDYAGTYHNIGFDALDMLAARLAAPSFSEKKDAALSDAVFSGGKVLLCKPLTYMNLSGDAVSRLARYYKIAPSDILIFYDDIDIHKGTVRARANGSAGTHNGMRDIVAKLGTTDFARIRIGTGMKPNYMDLADYVLSHIPSNEKPIMAKACGLAADLAEQWLKGEPWQSLTVTAE